MKNVNMSLFSFALLFTASAFAVIDDTAAVQDLIANSHVVLVKTTIPAVKVEVPAPVVVAPVKPVEVKVEAAHAKPAVQEPKFSFVAGFKKGVNYVISPIVAHPWIAALIASAGGLAYAHKKGYIRQLLVKMGAQKEEEAQEPEVVTNETQPVA
jgi:hypothetical protein